MSSRSTARWWAPRGLSLRLARRDALRARGRSALVVGMIALPIFGMTGIDVLARTGAISPAERVTLEIPHAQADVTAAGSGRCTQDPFDDASGCESSPGQPGPPTAADVVALRSLLPPGATVVPRVSVSGTVRHGDRSAPLGVVTFDLTAPAARGQLTPTGGRLPRRAGEVLVTARTLAELHAAVGDSLTLAGPHTSAGNPTTLATFTVVGTYRDRHPREDALTAYPGSLSGSDMTSLTGGVDYLVGGPPVTWTDVKRLNSAGFLAFSRYVVAHPPARSDVPFYATQGSSGGISVSGVFTILGIVLVVGLACLEVMLLAGAAFAVGARRQTRSLGLLAAAGGDRADIGRVVRMQGVVLGVVAAVVAVPSGVLAAVVGKALLTAHYGTEWGPLDVRALELVGIAAVAVVAGFLSALIPARTVSRQDVVAALSGRRGQTRTPKRWPVVGLIVVAGGVATAVAGALLAIAGYQNASTNQATVGALLILGGAVLSQLGLVVATPAVIGLAARLGGRLPLAPRLALRDAARHRGRTAPAVAAVMAAVAASTAIGAYVTSQDDRDRRGYIFSAPVGTGLVTLLPNTGGPAAVPVAPAVQARLTRTLAARGDVASVTPVAMTLGGGCTAEGVCSQVQVVVPPANRCPLEALTTPPTRKQTRQALTDPRCNGVVGYGGPGSGLPVGDGATVAALTGVRSSEADRVLSAGGIVVFSDRYLLAGRATVTSATGSTSGQGPETTRTFPAAYVSTPTQTVQAVLSPAAAAALGLRTAPGELVVRFSTTPSTSAETALADQLSAISPASNLVVERGYVDRYGPGLLALLFGGALITLVAAGVATGLAQADARADQATLAAVGASPRVRRTLATAQAGSVALLGALLGILAGFVPAVAYLWANPSMNVLVPWRSVVTLAVGVPLVAATAAGLLTRSRVPLERRLT